MPKRTLLIDADVVAYQAASSLEKAVEWAPGHWTWDVNFHEVCQRVDEVIEAMQETLEADAVVLCLTDPEANFRLDVLPSYKTHRSTVRKPLVLLPVKEWMVEEREAVMRPGLEGDDVMGILATLPNRGEQIIVSIDKDMKTIPGLYVRTKPVVDEMGVELVGAFDITEITPEEAEAYHMQQTLSGDVTDGYGGCPGIGDKRAQAIVAGKIGRRSYERVLKSGPRKGQSETRWEDYECETLWDAVVSQYEAAGLSETVALQQARVARILQANDYDMKKKEVILWTPKQ